jgi:hypothetical protein
MGWLERPDHVNESVQLNPFIIGPQILEPDPTRFTFFFNLFTIFMYFLYISYSQLSFLLKYDWMII